MMTVTATRYQGCHRPCDQNPVGKRRGETQLPAPHLWDLRPSAQPSREGWQPLDGRDVRYHGTAVSDRGQSASRRERVRAHSLPAIAGIRARCLEPLAGGSPRNSRGLSRQAGCPVSARRSGRPTLPGRSPRMKFSSAVRERQAGCSTPRCRPTTTPITTDTS
jgi:hypothetical protein